MNWWYDMKLWGWKWDDYNLKMIMYWKILGIEWIGNTIGMHLNMQMIWNLIK